MGRKEKERKVFINLFVTPEKEMTRNVGQEVIEKMWNQSGFFTPDTGSDQFPCLTGS